MTQLRTNQPGIASTGGGRGLPAWAVVAAWLAVSLLTAGRCAAAELRLRAECRSRGAVVTLGDVAEIRAADLRRADALAAIELFPAPPASKPRFLRLREIQDLLLLRGVNLAAHRFSGSSRVAVLGEGEPAGVEPKRRLSSSAVQRANRRVRDAVVQYLQQQVSADQPWEVEVELSEQQARLVAGPVQSMAITGGEAPWSGLQRFQVALATPQGPAQFPVDARVALPPAVVVAATSLPRGAILRATDVELRAAAPRDARSEVFYSISDVIGKQTTRTVPKGKALQRESLRAPLLVRRGEVVTVHARSPGVRVETTARAREDGSLGDLIPVESLLDRKTYLARVAAVREVEVYARSARTNSQPPATRHSLATR